MQHGLHVANAHAALQNKEAAQHGAEGIAEVIDQIRDGRDLARGGFRALGAALQLGVDLVEFRLGARRVVKGGNQFLAVVHFFNIAVELAQQFLLVGIMLGARFHHAQGGKQRYGHHGHGDERQLGAGGEHHHQDAHGGDHLRDDLCQVLA